jgi:putative PIN family toxin of toxin-antitoxin system
MPKVVIDTTVAVSAFLNARPGGAAFDLLDLCRTGAFELILSNEILEEMADVLLTRGHLRRRFQYTDADAVEFCQELARMATLAQDIPEITVVRDPADDMVLACALAAGAEYLVTRDNDLLSLGTYREIEIITPEVFLRTMRERE